MPETDTIPVSASVASTGLGIRYIGEHCYAYSGTIEPGGEATALNFTTGSGYIVGRFEMNADFKGGGGNDYAVKIKFNENTIVFEQDIANNWLAGDNEFHIIIPPFTIVEGLLNDGGANKDMNLNFTGRVYGEE